MVRVARVHAGSIAEQLEITPGTELLVVNGREIADFLDWEFLSSDQELVIEGRTAEGEEAAWEVERDDETPFGVELEPPRIRRCANKCEFCFIEGLPPGLRRSLYVRDDDYRLSFAYGNFATLSNLKESDYERILGYRLTPLYVSVHATNHAVRKVLLSNPRVPDIMPQLRRLSDGGIRFHCQMVIVPGMNDEMALEESLSDLWSLDEAALTVAVVPVGLTQFSHLYSGEPMSRRNANELLSRVDTWSDRALRERGHRWVYGSDELYLLADRPFPESDHYGDFPQIENGVGAVAWLRERVRTAGGTLRNLKGQRIAIVTGLSMEREMRRHIEQLTEATGADYELLPLVNSLFGPTTTASGLLPGADLVEALRGRDDLDLALIPAETLNDSRVFLDDLTLAELRAASPVPVIPSYDFVDALSSDPELLLNWEPGTT